MRLSILLLISSSDVKPLPIVLSTFKRLLFSRSLTFHRGSQQPLKHFKKIDEKLEIPTEILDLFFIGFSFGEDLKMPLPCSQNAYAHSVPSPTLEVMKRSSGLVFRLQGFGGFRCWGLCLLSWPKRRMTCCLARCAWSYGQLPQDLHPQTPTPPAPPSPHHTSFRTPKPRT